MIGKVERERASGLTSAEECCILAEGKGGEGRDRRGEWLFNVGGEVGEDIFRGGEGDVLSAGPGEDAIEKGVFGDGTVVGAAAGDEPGINIVADNILNCRCFGLGAVLLKEIEGGAGGSDRVHFSIREKGPTIPVGCCIHGTDIGKADAEGIIEGGSCVESGIAAGTAAYGGEIMNNDTAFLCNLLQNMVHEGVMLVHKSSSRTIAKKDDCVGMVDLKVLKDVRIAQPVDGTVAATVIQQERGMACDFGRNVEEASRMPINSALRICFVWFCNEGIIEWNFA